jgi:hypothetical protein
MKNLRAALNHVRNEAKDGKAQLIRELNLPVKILKYGSKEDYVSYVIRNSNMDHSLATSFVEKNVDKFKN